MSYSSHLMSPLFQAAKLWGSSFFLSFFLSGRGGIFSDGILNILHWVAFVHEFKENEILLLGEIRCVCVCVLRLVVIRAWCWMTFIPRRRRKNAFERDGVCKLCHVWVPLRF